MVYVMRQFWASPRFAGIFTAPEYQDTGDSALLMIQPSL